MGVEYFKCSECDEVICDAGDYEVFDIEDFDTIQVCEYCGEQLRSKLKLVEPWTNIFLAVASGERIVYHGYEEALEGLEKYGKDNIKFGLYMSKNKLSEDEIMAWTGKTNKTLHDTSDEELQKHRYFGWYDHKILGSERDYIDLYYNRHVNISSLVDYVKKSRLNERPILLTLHQKTIEIFSNPNSLSIEWFDTLDDANNATYSGKYIPSSISMSWKPTKSYIDEKVEQLRSEIREKQAIIHSLTSIYLEE